MKWFGVAVLVLAALVGGVALGRSRPQGAATPLMSESPEPSETIATYSPSPRQTLDMQEIQRLQQQYGVPQPQPSTEQNSRLSRWAYCTNLANASVPFDINAGPEENTQQGYQRSQVYNACMSGG